MNKIKKVNKSTRDMGFPMKNGQNSAKKDSVLVENRCIFGNLLDSEMEKLKNIKNRPKILLYNRN